MLFNSFQFAIFFVIVYTFYLLLRNHHRLQNTMLLAASYVFYGVWNWRFLFLLFISTGVDYYCARKIYETENHKKRKAFLWLSIAVNLSILGFFKYYDFFMVNLQYMLTGFGIQSSFTILHVILPIGISFYTFQALSYTIDVYRKELVPAKNFFDFALFVSFFPQLVAGPIERAAHLLPQVLSSRKIELKRFIDGCYLILWGLFIKMFVADNLARIVDAVFAQTAYNGIEVILAAYAFSFQIYCDFAGYSEIARGLGKCMGFDIMVNFNLPFFSTNPSEFWKRWHISLSSWFRDYVYIPLGGSRKGQIVSCRNLAITIILAGMWHGAAWTFALFGFYWALLSILYRLLSPLLCRISPPKNRLAERIFLVLRITFFFQLAALGFLIFRAQSIQQIYHMLASVVSIAPAFTYDIQKILVHMFYYLWIMCVINAMQFYKKDLMILHKWPVPVLAIVHAAMFYLMVFNSWAGKKFIYFEF